MANLRTSADLIDHMLFRAGEPTDGTSDFDAVAPTSLNRAYQIVWSGGGEFDPSIQEDWWWLRKATPGKLILQPLIETGKVSVTRGNASITFSAAPSPAIDASLASGWFFKVDDHADVFRISTHTSGSTAATLDSVYTGGTATGKGFRLFKLEYALATDVLRIVSPMRTYQDNRSEIDGADLPALERDSPMNNIQAGVPRRFAFVGERKVRFSHAGGSTSGDLIRSEYDYHARPSDLTDATGEPVVPMGHRKVLSDLGLYFLPTDTNDNRAEGGGRLGRCGRRAMARENRQRKTAVSRLMGKMLPRQTELPENVAPLRTEAGLIIG